MYRLEKLLQSEMMKDAQVNMLQQKFHLNSRRATQKDAVCFPNSPLSTGSIEI